LFKTHNLATLPFWLVLSLAQRPELEDTLPPILESFIIEAENVLFRQGTEPTKRHLLEETGARVTPLRPSRCASQGGDYRRLVGLPAEGATPKPTRPNRLTALLAAIGAPR